MEDTLGERTTEFSMEKVVSLNPCSNGRYFRRSIRKSTRVRLLVLILVLMEDTLGDLFLMSNDACWLVLILVLMEDTLGDKYG